MQKNLNKKPAKVSGELFAAVFLRMNYYGHRLAHLPKKVKQSNMKVERLIGLETANASDR